MNNPKTTQKLHNKVRELIIEAKTVVRRSVNLVTVVQNWEVGRLIVKGEEEGKPTLQQLFLEIKGR